ncbi:MAG TPA: nuclear transport factor 2 family protein [Candidatus Limnocylindrales bacterium]|jgi:ketosteroid isomerase-like protein
MTHDDVQAWLDRYIDAWRTYDPAAIGDLFAEDAEYRYHPYDEPERGRDTIVRDWVEPEGGASTRDAPGSWDAHYEPYAVEGDRAVATGWSRYFATGDTPEKLYHNVYLLEFDGDGRCRSFIEYYVLQRTD